MYKYLLNSASIGYANNAQVANPNPNLTLT